MFLRHPHHPSTGGHYQHHVVRAVASEGRYCGPQILLVPGQVNERDELGGVFTDVFSRAVLGVVYRVALRVEPKNLMRYGTCSATLNLMKMSKHVESCSPPSVVQL